VIAAPLRSLLLVNDVLGHLLPCRLRLPSLLVLLLPQVRLALLVLEPLALLPVH
jgi:hypothetical protein